MLLLLLAVFIVSCLVLLFYLDKTLSAETPAKGGILREGIIGTPRFVNPVLTISDADRDLSILIYSGLLRVSKDKFANDLAESYEIDEEGLCYTFTLKPDLLWSDDAPLTSDDILFTIKNIRNPLTKSSKRASWEGVGVEKIDDRKIRFCLEKPYAPFLENTTLGILPKHIWNDILPEQMSLSDFNIKAVGSGPYKVEKISRNSSGIITSYALIPNENFALDAPYIKKLVIKFYPSEKKLIEAYETDEIDSLSAISPKNIIEIQKDKSFLKTYLLPRVFAVFFNQDDAAVFAEEEVRKALSLSVDKKRIINDVLENFGIALVGPIPPGSLGSHQADFTIENKSYEESLEEAVALLNKNGWKMDEEEGVLVKKKGESLTKLEFSLSTSDVADLVQTAYLLKEMWEKIGAKIEIRIYEIGDLEQNVIRPRKYNALLFGEIMGRDPDPFAFWHSSQRNDPGLNIALYTSITADKLLEDARTIFDAQEREEKYKKFQEEVIDDSPAVFLYSPYFIHLLPRNVGGINEISITTPSERFSQVYNWYIKTQKIWKIFLEK